MAKNLFNSIVMTKPKRNVFDLTHDVKLSLDLGNLVPVMCLDCVPGDKVKLSANALIRFQPLVAPVMHRFDVTIHYFAVAKRLLWDKWEQYITNTPDEITGLLPAYPTVNINSSSWTELHDYFGIPPIPESQTAFGVDISAMQFAAYQFIYNEWYRAQDLIGKVNYKCVDGDNSGNADLSVLRKRAWEHDYFSAALPFAQKGAQVNIPLGQFNDVPVWLNSETSGSTTLEGTPDDITVGKRESADSLDPIQLGQLYAETSSLEAGSSNITDLRRAFKLQEWLERAARAGSRYAENIRAFFGVKPRDSRMQRPEYITGTKSALVIGEVLNTTGTEDAPQGGMAGHGISVLNGRGGFYSCDEHMFIIGIMSVMPKPAYMQGIERQFLKTVDPFDHFWPQFEHIGEQAIQKQELLAYTGNDADETFGYIPRYAEYKYMPNRVAGQFRTQLDFWHAARKFDYADQPALNQQFIEVDHASEDMTRIFAVLDTDQKILAQVINQVTAVRPMAKYGNPMM